MSELNNPRFRLLVLAASAYVFLLLFLQPFPLHLVGGIIVHGMLAMGGGFGLAKLYVQVFPDRPMTVRMVFRTTAPWSYLLLLALCMWSAGLQGVNPFHVVLTLFVGGILVIGVPWFLWRTLVDLLTAIARIFGR